MFLRKHQQVFSSCFYTAKSVNFKGSYLLNGWTEWHQISAIWRLRSSSIKKSGGHFCVTSLLHDVFASRSSRGVSPLLSIIINYYYYYFLSAKNFALPFQKNYSTNSLETLPGHLLGQWAALIEKWSTLTDDLDLQRSKVIFNFILNFLQNHASYDKMSRNKSCLRFNFTHMVTFLKP